MRIIIVYLKQFITIWSLILIFLIQLGSVGFTYYRNDCASSKMSTFSLKNKGCCCKKDDESLTDIKSCCKKKDSEKSCCKSKTKNNCSKSNSNSKPLISNNCCNSTSIVFKVLSEEYVFEDLNFSVAKN